MSARGDEADTAAVAKSNVPEVIHSMLIATANCFGFVCILT